MFIYCVSLEDTEEDRKIVFKTFKERKRDIIQERDNPVPP
jgi:hypothetical protein